MIDEILNLGQMLCDLGGLRFGTISSSSHADLSFNGFGLPAFDFPPGDFFAFFVFAATFLDFAAIIFPLLVIGFYLMDLRPSTRTVR